MTGVWTLSRVVEKEAVSGETAEPDAPAPEATPRSQEEHQQCKWLWQCPWRHQAIPPDSDPGGLSWWPFPDSQGSQA